MTLAGGSLIFLAFVVLYTLAVTYSLYTRTGSGINQRPWGEEGYSSLSPDEPTPSPGRREPPEGHGVDALGAAGSPAAKDAFAAEAISLQDGMGARVVDVGVRVEALDAPGAHGPIAGEAHRRGRDAAATGARHEPEADLAARLVACQVEQDHGPEQLV